MNTSISPFVLLAIMLILGATLVNLIALRANNKAEPAGTRYIEKIKSTRKKGMIFFLLALIFTTVYYFFYTQNHLEGRTPPLLKRVSVNSHSLKMLELSARSFQKSFMFYATSLIIPLVSSRRFRVLGIDEKTSIAFVKYYSLLGSFLYPLVFHVCSGHDLGSYLVEVLNIAETSLLLSLYSLLLLKMCKVHDVLSYTQVITKFEIEEVLDRVKPKIIGIIGYLCLDGASGVARMTAMFFAGDYSRGLPVNSLVETAFFIALYYYSIKFLVTPGNGICESIQKMENIKKHVAAGFLNLEHRDEDSMIDVSKIPNI
ncbi:hypothetical protein EROM_081150 [Encephalitozoon romaleae SJ-2008]|uniref:Uncharacterized protein n=1 Tax=Encephalitozoon romaleae (strain SJ-2008) TaxID=1178016 RepID=I6ZUW3_ENCRO|nr:hypothetical protein EROM_081150 [Encephalitozoon romaleae SJ-2008]AFN83531.1 hypothetical protein EROM_081150 [Encephalitozoon romaleae SJ-2008]